jgi:FkbM family methyltransferase
MRVAAAAFPTRLMGERPWLAALWRVLFYAIAPTRPFRFRTRDYEMIAVPDRWHLSRSVLRKGHWERFVTDVFRSHLQPGMTVVDVGANFGHFALTAAHAVGAEGRVLAFEPHPRVFADLVRNAALLPHGNLQAFPCALGETRGEMPMAVDEKTSARSSLVAELVPNPGRPVMVPVRRLDEVLAEVAPSRRVGLIKVDTEGFEGQVFRGIGEVLVRDRPVLLTEFSPKRMEQAGTDGEALLEQLQALGYRIRILDEKAFRIVAASLPARTWRERFPSSLNNVDSEAWFCNLLLEPGDGTRT